jgi:hypothetical protein
MRVNFGLEKHSVWQVLPRSDQTVSLRMRVNFCPEKHSVWQVLPRSDQTVSLRMRVNFVPEIKILSTRIFMLFDFKF